MHLAHVLCIRLPVGRESQRAAGRDRFRQQLDERRLNQPPLVMALLRPRIRKEDVHERDRGGRELLLQHFHGVVTDHAQIAQRRRFRAEQQVSDAGPMHFDADAIDLRMRSGEFEQRFARAEADLQHARRRAAEQRVQIERRRGETRCRISATARASARC